jgi:large subunit ribosomal protein L23
MVAIRRAEIMRKSEILINPIITEKSTMLQEAGKYCFKVDRRANKKEVMRAVKELFEVEPVSCAMMTVRGKRKRVRYQPGYTPGWKKAIVTLKEEQTIELFEGV